MLTGNAPLFEQVHMFFRQNGHTEEVAQLFYNKWEAVGWVMGMSPIRNWGPLAYNFIYNYEKNQQRHGSTGKSTVTSGFNGIDQAFSNIQRDLDATMRQGG